MDMSIMVALFVIFLAVLGAGYYKNKRNKIWVLFIGCTGQINLFAYVPSLGQVVE